ncbi:MAG: amidohydrolase family protein, partial [Lachnospiraceae bacterium]|nr:amidohydrolase family protein [Lachnospiraceae bacterium]
PETDAIAPGKKADIILLDLMQPNMQPLQNIPRNIVYSGSKSNVLMTMVGGSILYERRESIDDSFHVGESASEIFRAAQEVRDRILG